MKQRRMGDREVLNAKMSGDLIVNDAVSNRRQETDQDDLCLLAGQCWGWAQRLERDAENSGFRGIKTFRRLGNQAFRKSEKW